MQHFLEPINQQVTAINVIFDFITSHSDRNNGIQHTIVCIFWSSKCSNELILTSTEIVSENVTQSSVGGAGDDTPIS